MRIVLAKNWWSLVIRGVAAVLLGVITFARPGITLEALVLVFGAYALIDGVLGLTGAFRASRSGERWGALSMEGAVGIAAGLVTFAWPAITALALGYLIAAWALVTGIFEIVAAVRLRHYITHEWLLALGGAASVAFGFVLMMAPLLGALVLAIWLGAYAFVFGALLIALGFRLRKSPEALDAGSPLPAPSH